MDLPILPFAELLGIELVSASPDSVIVLRNAGIVGAANEVHFACECPVAKAREG